MPSHGILSEELIEWNIHTIDLTYHTYKFRRIAKIFSQTSKISERGCKLGGGKNVRYLLTLFSGEVGTEFMCVCLCKILADNATMGTFASSHTDGSFYIPISQSVRLLNGIFDWNFMPRQIMADAIILFVEQVQTILAPSLVRKSNSIRESGAVRVLR